MSVLRKALIVTAATTLVACTQENNITEPAGPAPVAFDVVDAASVCSGGAMPEIQCEALVALYNATDGANWYFGNWATEPDPCSWYRVTCNPDATVRSISLYQNNLAGTIPAAIGDLADLVDLRLWGNAITGPIPPSLGNLANLEVLILGDNAITGSIPDELANLTRATIFSIVNAGLTGTVPTWLADLPDLQDLRLAGNRLSGEIPVELAALPAIREVNLGRNDLTGGIPAAFGTSSTLKLLLLGDNQLTGLIPPELGDLSQLTSLSLHHNQLSGTIPAELGSLDLIDVLYLEDNQLDGLVPLEFAERAASIFVCLIGPPGNDGLYMPDVEAYRATDVDGDGVLCGLPFATAEDIGEDAAGAIDELVPDPLTEGQANALTAKIDNAIAKAASGQYNAAINQMQAFLAQLGDMVANGTLTPAEAAPLNEQAEFLIAMWTEMV